MFFVLRKLSRFSGKFSSSELVKDTFYIKYFSVLTQYYRIDLKITITFFSKQNKYISLIYFM